MKTIYFALLSLLLISFDIFLRVPQHSAGVFSENKIPEKEDEDYFFMQHSFPYGKIDYEAQHEAAVSFKKNVASRNASSVQWEFAGPTNIGGRITDIEFDPSNMDI